MHIYYPYAYVVDENGNTVADLGVYTMIVQGYTGTTGDFATAQDYWSYMADKVEDTSKIGGSGVVAASFSTTLLDYIRQFAPAFEPIYLPSVDYPVTNKLKLLFPETGDYLLSYYSFSSSAAGRAMIAYDRDNNLLFGNLMFYIPGSSNSLNTASLTSNSYAPILTPASIFTDDGFNVNATINDYFISGSPNTPGFCGISRNNNNTKFYEFLNRQTPGYEPGPEPPEDPYEPGGYSGTGGGGGGQNFASTPIGRAPLPTLSFADTGFCRIYNPTLAQLQALANYMWTDDTFLQTVINHAKQLLEDPIQSIISLSMVPVPVPQGNPENVKVLFIPTGVSMAPITNQFVEIDCGTLSLPVEDQYGAALDFNPYTKIDLYLPYIGQVSIDTDEVMYKTISCKYNVDVVTGACVASIATGSGADETVLYQFSGHCSIEMPLTSADFSSWIASIIGAVKMVTAVGAAAAGHPEISAGLMALPSPGITGKTTTVKQGGGWEGRVTQTERNPSTGRQITVGTRATERTNRSEISTTTHEVTPPSFGELASKGAANTVDAIMASKLQVQHAGGFSGNSGYIAAVRRPYAIIKRPRQCYPENYASYRGFPAMIYMNLGDCEGYTEVHDIHLTGISATNPELGELAQLLKTGVIL